MRRAPLCAGALALALANNDARAQGPTPATPVDLPDTPAELVLDAQWSAVLPLPALEASGLGPQQLGPARLVAAYRLSAKSAKNAKNAKSASATLAVVRFDAPNSAAWRKRTRKAAYDAIEEGLAGACRDSAAPRACAGLRLGKRKELVLSGVPSVQWQAEGKGRTLLVRLLLFRTYTLAAVTEAPRRSRALEHARKAVSSFGPPKDYSPGG